jgi:hypothetical protein
MTEAEGPIPISACRREGVMFMSDFDEVSSLNLDLAQSTRLQKRVFLDEFFRETQLSGISRLPTAPVRGFLNAAEPPCRVVPTPTPS